MTQDDKVAYNYARERLDNDDYPVYSDEYELEHAFKAGIEYAKQWISVEDELPIEDGYYLCVICETSIQALFYNDELEEWYEFYLTKEEHLDCEDLTKKVTHWMPLPQPPREIRGNQRKISPNQQQIIGTPEHIKTALDVMDKKGGEQ